MPSAASLLARPQSLAPKGQVPAAASDTLLTSAEHTEFPPTHLSFANRSLSSLVGSRDVWFSSCTCCRVSGPQLCQLEDEGGWSRWAFDWIQPLHSWSHRKSGLSDLHCQSSNPRTGFVSWAIGHPSSDAAEKQHWHISGWQSFSKSYIFLNNIDNLCFPKTVNFFWMRKNHHINIHMYTNECYIQMQYLHIQIYIFIQYTYSLDELQCSSKVSGLFFTARNWVPALHPSIPFPPLRIHSANTPTSLPSSRTLSSSWIKCWSYTQSGNFWPRNHLSIKSSHSPWIQSIKIN